MGSQYFLLMPAKMKEAYLDCLLNKLIGSTYRSLIVVVENNMICERLFLILKELGYFVNTFRSQKTQTERTRILEKHTNNRGEILIVNYREIPKKTMLGDAIINYNLPNTPKDYIRLIHTSHHLKENCHSFSFITPNELGYLDGIETLIGHRLRSFNLTKAELSGAIL